MLRKTHFIPTALVACSLLGFDPAARVEAQNPAAPAAPVAPATLNRMFNEAETAFSEQRFDEAVSKIQELLKLLEGKKNAPLELLYFNIGLGYLLGDKPVEAEAAFTECLKRFPKGEYASRCYLGVGRAAMLQNTPEKKERALEALKIAAQDPKYRSEAGLWLGQVYSDLGRHDEALVVFKSLMGSDVRTPQQTNAAVEVISLLVDSGKQEDLVLYLDRLINQAGVRDAMAWYANQVIVKADEMVANQSYDSALAIYRSIPPRNEILETQRIALESQKRDIGLLERRVESEKNKPLDQRTRASELLNAMKPAVELAETALAAIEEKKFLDAALLMRRGRCLYYLDRNEEALVCFRAIRTKYPEAEDAQAAAYAEIIIYSKLKDVPKLKELCAAYLRKFPKADNAEQVATLAGEVLIQSGDWQAVRDYYDGLIKDFPESENLGRFKFFKALGYFQDGDFKESAPIFADFIKTYPDNPLYENALYYVAMSNFLQNNYKEVISSIKDYLGKFPDGRYAGDLRYRLAFIDFNDKDVDQSDKLIKDLTTFLESHPDDEAAGSMLCLIGDTWKRKTSKKQDELARFEKKALEAYKKAIWSDSPDDVVQYALDSATGILQGDKDWAGIAELHSEFLKRKPDSQLALLSASWVAKMKVREGKGPEAAAMLADAAKGKIGNPANEQVEFLLDELVKTLIPRKKPKDLDIDAIDTQLQDIINNAIKGQENATTNARLYYARARLAELLRRRDRSDLYLKGIATINAKDPTVLSPALLAVSGDILLKLGQLDEAEAMFRRLADRYQDGLYADAGPVGLGYIALERKQPEEALKIFENALENNPGMSRFKETTLGLVEALAAVGRLDDAEQRALQIVGDKMFRGEPAAKAYLLLGSITRQQAAKASGSDEKLELLKKAHGYYQRVYVAYQSVPEVCAEAYWQAYETAKEMGNQELAEETLKTLREHPKLQNTARVKKLGTGAP
jgi:TolA-binding protein